MLMYVNVGTDQSLSKKDHQYRVRGSKVLQIFGCPVNHTKGPLRIFTEKVQEQFAHHLLLVFYINMTKSTLSLFGVSVCPDLYLYSNSARSTVIFHFIQVFLP